MASKKSNKTRFIPSSGNVFADLRLDNTDEKQTKVHERLMHFLNPLDRDIEIVVRPRPRSRKGARILVTAA